MATSTELLKRPNNALQVAGPVDGVLINLHGAMVAAASALCDVIVGYRTYPHVDMHACGTERPST